MVHIEVIESFPPACASSELLERIQGICSWKESPSTWIGGRSACYRPLGPLAEETGLGAIRFKGLGIGPTGQEKARPPESQPYDRWPGQPPDEHFGISPDGEFALVGGDPAPTGGLLIEGAAREIQCAADLSKHRAASIEPLALVSYPDLRLSTRSRESAELGIAVTGTRTTSTERCSVLVPGWDRGGPGSPDALRRFAEGLGFDPQSTDVKQRLRMLGEAYRRFGESLRVFANAGWYRYSGHPGNLQLDESGEVILPDLDSSRPMSDLSSELAGLEAVRDGMSGLYNLACTFFLPGVIDAVADYELHRDEPFSAFLDGWDPGSAGSNDQAGGAIAEYVITSRMQLRTFEPFLRGGSEAADHLYRFVRHDRDLTFIWLFRQLFQRRQRRPFGPPLEIPLDVLDDRLLRFAGRPRFDRMMDLEHKADPSRA